MQYDELVVTIIYFRVKTLLTDFCLFLFLHDLEGKCSNMFLSSGVNNSVENDLDLEQTKIYYCVFFLKTCCPFESLSLARSSRRLKLDALRNRQKTI